MSTRRKKPKPVFRKNHLWTGRTLVWFSCGAASAVAWKLALEQFPDESVEACYCSDTLSAEHVDNIRFLADVEKWVGRKVTMLRSDKYNSIFDVFEGERYLNGPHGAPCTRTLKRNVRIAYQEPWDWHIFGYTVDEQDRIERFEAENPDVNVYWMLRDQGVTKNDCYAILNAAGIALPTMYLLGYRNNNCIGCVKGGAGYWNKIRVDFPEAFWRMARLERTIGHALLKLGGVPVYLDELPPDVGRYESEPDIECGPQCIQIMSRIGETPPCAV